MDRLLSLATLRRHALPCAGLVLVGVALFGRVLGFDFVRYDDHEFLVVHQGALARPSFVLAAFWRDAFAVLGPASQGVFYRPLLIASYGLEAQLSRPDPTLFHASNLALHLLASLSVYALFVAFGCSRALAFALAAVFCSHPSAALVVAWIPGRNDSMLAIACIASTMALLTWLRSGRRGALALCVAGYTAALFTKESGVALLAVLGSIALFAPGERGARRDLALAAAAALAISAVWAALRYFTLGGTRLGLTRVLGNAEGLLVYLGKTFAPVDLAAIPHPADTALWPGGIVLALLAVAVALTGRRLWGPAGIGLVWYGAFLLPTLLVPRETWGLEQRLYLPLVGMLLFVSQLGPVFGRRVPALLGIAALCTAAALFATATARRLPDFSNPIVFWEAAARDAPHSAHAASRVAWRYFEARRFEDAVVAADRALALDSEQSDLYLVRGAAAANLGDWQPAVRDFEQAVAREPESAEAWEHLARVQRRLGREDQSRESRRRAAELRRR
jgi:tetratricopeptide (TPR) repeat protein